MNINDTAEQAAFRAEVRDWIAQRVPPHMKGQRQGIVGRAELTREQLKPYWDALAAKGWLAPHWPVEYGGAGFNTLQMVIFNEEVTRAGVPFVHETPLNNLAPILMKHGTDKQKETFLGPTMRRDIQWCQGYSEPDAGSDLASLGTRAEKVAGGYKVSGQKIWTSFAHEADWIFLLARTDPHPKRKQEGISFLLIDMKSPGIDLRVVVTIDDYNHFNEIFFDEVFVPQENLVGEEGKGWSVAKSLLGFERFNHYRGNPILIGRCGEDLKAAARTTPAGAGAVWDDSGLRREMAQVDMDNDCMRYTRYRSLSQVSRGESPGPEASIPKMFGSEMMQRIIDRHQKVLGTSGATVGDEPFGRDIGELGRYTPNIRSCTIAGGTVEIQRNILAKRVLGLPD